MKELTARQQEILDLIKESIKNKGFPPTETRHLGVVKVRGLNLVPRPADSSNALKGVRI